MSIVRLGLREIGTAYVGKEPCEYTVDVLRQLVLRYGAELGFESCLTSRPFTTRTFVADNLGASRPGRGDENGARRAEVDLADGLAVLGLPARPAEATDLDNVADLAGRAGRAFAVIAGPVRVDDRWCPLPDRLLDGEAWRFLVVEWSAGDDLVCFDPVFGGFTSLPAVELALLPVQVVQAPRPMPSTGPWSAGDMVARRCLAAGVGWRAAADGEPTSDRDAAGFLALADHADGLTGAAAVRRLRLALRRAAAHAQRWSVLLGHSGHCGFDGLALADVLHDTIGACRVAESTLVTRDVSTIGQRLRQLAGLAEATTELSQRLTARGVT